MIGMSTQYVIVRRGRNTAGKPWAFTLSVPGNPNTPQTYRTVEHAERRIEELTRQAILRGVLPPVWDVVPVDQAPPTSITLTPLE